MDIFRILWLLNFYLIFIDFSGEFKREGLFCSVGGKNKEINIIPELLDNAQSTKIIL